MSTSVTRLFGLEGGTWMRHANPMSVWTRYDPEYASWDY
jgi:hypothetical protein